VNHAIDCIVDCINSSVQDSAHGLAKVTEHSNIDEGNISNIQDAKEELWKDT